MLEFPRYVFNGKATQIVNSEAEYASALDMGWFSTLGEATPAPVKPEGIQPPPGVEVAETLVDAPPTREELEQKATELGIKFDKRTGDKKLAQFITVALGG